jgi:hypothetical protein
VDSLNFWMTSPAIDAARYGVEALLLGLLAATFTVAAIRNHLIGRVRPAIVALALFMWPTFIRISVRSYVQLGGVITGDTNHTILGSWWLGLNDWLLLAATALLFVTILIAYPDVRR